MHFYFLDINSKRPHVVYNTPTAIILRCKPK